MRILLVKMSSMGDVIHNMPLIHDIKQHYPEAIIDWVVEESFVELARLNPLINKVIPIAMRRWKKAIFSKNTWVQFFHFRRSLRGNYYDAILDTQGLIKSAVIAKIAKGISYGQNANTSHEYPAHWLLNEKLEISRNLHAISRNRLIGAKALNYVFDEHHINYDLHPPTQTDTSLLSILPKKCIMLFHSTARDSKHWPNDYWINLGQFLESQNYTLALPWGSHIEKKRAESIAAALSNVVVLPKLSIVQLATLIKSCIACVGLDTGLTHIAVALNVPTLAIFTDTFIWQASAQPALQGRAITIGGKPSMPSVENAIEGFRQLMPPSYGEQKCLDQ